jgi:hypothetical protein
MLKDRHVIFRADEKYFHKFINKELYGLMSESRKSEKYWSLVGKDWKKLLKSGWWRVDGDF